MRGAEADTRVLILRSPRLRQTAGRYRGAGGVPRPERVHGGGPRGGRAARDGRRGARAGHHRGRGALGMIESIFFRISDALVFYIMRAPFNGARII